MTLRLLAVDRSTGIGIFQRGELPDSRYLVLRPPYMNSAGREEVDDFIVQNAIGHGDYELAQDPTTFESEGGAVDFLKSEHLAWRDRQNDETPDDHATFIAVLAFMSGTDINSAIVHLAAGEGLPALALDPVDLLRDILRCGLERLDDELVLAAASAIGTLSGEAIADPKTFLMATNPATRHQSNAVLERTCIRLLASQSEHSEAGWSPWRAA